MIYIDVQPLTDEQRDALRSRTVAAVCAAIGALDRYVSVLIREHQPTNMVEAGGWGSYDQRRFPEVPGYAASEIEATRDK